MVVVTPRQTDILEIAKENGRVDVDSLAEHFSVSPQTIRKDLNDLCELEALQRVHGGAVYPLNTSNYAYHARRKQNLPAKSGIGKLAASLIPNHSSLIINIGTTTEQVASDLLNHAGLVVITNNLNVAFILAASEQIEAIVAGGTVRTSDGGIVGSSAVDLVKQFKPDFAIIGTSAIDEDGCLLDFDYREVKVTQQILKQARKKILVADRSKFERRAPVHVSHLSEIDIFVTDMPLPDHIADLCRTIGVRVEIYESSILEDIPAETPKG